MHRACTSLHPPQSVSQCLASVQVKARRDELVHGQWMQLQGEDGATFYYNRLLNETAVKLNKEQQKYLVAEAMPPLNPYDNHMYMPLTDYIQTPEAAELLHNGQTLQVCMARSQ